MHDEEFRCALPFDASRHPIEIVQGRHGPYSHFAERQPPFKDLSYAIDFRLPVGASILAVCRGRVRTILDVSTSCYRGMDRREASEAWPNLVVVDCGGEILDAYIHLLRGSVRVQVGQCIEEGQLLGQVGDSGWVGPISTHLHFQRYSYGTQSRRLQMQTLPISFRDYDGPLEHQDLLVCAHV